MKKIGDYKIGFKLNVFITMVLVNVFVAFGIYIINTQKNKILADTKIRMTEQAEDLAEMIELQVFHNQQAVSALSNMVYDVFKSQGEVNFHENRTQTIEGINQITKEPKTYTIKALEYNGNEIYKNYSFVDNI